jgi:1-acyl-sn-glycerol-3-phosphate acyltransferase
MPSFDYCRRICGTAVSFSLFGLGALAISVFIFPVLHITTLSRRRAQRRCQYIVHVSFRLFVWVMKSLGVLTYEIEGRERLTGNASLLVANHPTLIDVVFIVSMVPHATCVVKKAAWSNPFLAGVMLATGYIQNNDPEQLIAECVDCLARDSTLLIFPEATRTVPGHPMKLKRGAATVIATSGKTFAPVVISCTPLTLTKGKKWHDIPDQRGHFQITVGTPVEPAQIVIDGERRTKNNRRINCVLLSIFEGGIERHEQRYGERS